MKIMALGNNSVTNFKGIMVKTPKERCYEEQSLEAFVREIEYDYYSFSDETPEETKEAITPYCHQRHIARYPLWDSWEFSSVNVKPLSLTKSEYEKLKQKGVADRSIIDVYR